MVRKKILISTALRQQMYKKYGVVPRTVKDAMEFRTTTALARVLQDYALENGGELWVPASEDEIEEEGGEA